MQKRYSHPQPTTTQHHYYTVLLLLLLITSSITKVVHAQWQPLGPSDFNQPSYDFADFTSIAIDNNNHPYVVYRDYIYDFKATVAMFNGKEWEMVGNRGFSKGEIGKPTIAIDGSNTPYVVYNDFKEGNRATAMKYKGGQWVAVGNAGFSDGIADYISMVLDKNGTPYVAYKDGGHANKATVMKYDGNKWVTVGNAGFSAGTADFTSIAVDNNGTPYVIYRDNGNNSKATVMKYNGNIWVVVGTTGFSTGEAYSTSIAINNNNTPYVIFNDSNINKAVVMQYDGNAWVLVGKPGISNGSAGSTSIIFNSNNAPYIVFNDFSVNNKASVMKLDGNDWLPVGNAAFFIGGDYISIAMDKNDTLYVTYQDFRNDNKIIVQKFDNKNWKAVETRGLSEERTRATNITVDKAGIPYIVYRDDNHEEKATVVKYDGKNWQPIGKTGFSDETIDNAAIAVDNNGMPYIVYSNNNASTKGIATIMKYDGKDWITIGKVDEGIFRNKCHIAVNNNNVPYITYLVYEYQYDPSSGHYTPLPRTIVKEFNGSSWVTIANMVDHNYSSSIETTFFDSKGVLHILFNQDIFFNQDYTKGVKLMKYNGNSWETIRSLTFPKAYENYESVAVDDSLNYYIAIKDNTSYNRATVVKFNGRTWEIVGKQAITAGTANHLSIALDKKENIPYITYYNGGAWAYKYECKAETSTDTITSCTPYKWIDGKTYTASNNTATYTYTGGATTGCDSIVTLNLTVTTIDTTVTVANGTITANQPGASYQWVHCKEKFDIPGATKQSYECPNSNYYAVKITIGNCSATSSCTLVITAINDFSIPAVLIYPNPANNSFTIEGGNLKTISIYDVLGKKINAYTVAAEKTIINTTEWATGIYFITILNSNGFEIKYKLVVSH